MNVRIIPAKAVGRMTAPPSKSMAHRLLIGAALSRGKSTVTGVSFSEDILATLDCLEALGAAVQRDEAAQTVIITGFSPESIPEHAVLPCRESGSTLRFLLPVALLCDKVVTFTGKGRLPQRPLEAYRTICAQQGLTFTQQGDAVVVRGPLRAGEFSMPGDSSSQFISGLLFALPLLKGNSRIVLESALESGPYVDMTIDALKTAGIAVEKRGDREILVPGNQCFQPLGCRVEGDYSNAAFLEALNMMGGTVQVDGLSDNSHQGDKVFFSYFSAIQEGTPTLSVRDCPDLAPILMTMAALHHGAVLEDTKRLRLKESDRGHAMAEELQKCGADISVEENRIIIRPATLRAPIEILCGHNDHRIVMSLAVLATRLGGEIEEAQAVNKSYPAFWEDLIRLGIPVERLSTTW